MLCLMCGGDGLADIIGRKYGSLKLPFNKKKSWIGSVAMFAGEVDHASGLLQLIFVIVANVSLLWHARSQCSTCWINIAVVVAFSRL